MIPSVHWVYLVVAACLEVCWIYSVKFLDFKKVWQISWSQLLKDQTQMQILLPLIGYIVFGVTNIMLFSVAMRKIPASTAFAVWMALALIGARIVEIAWFKDSFTWANIFFLVLILIGIIGLKSTTQL
jgi:quaternary ammonium compound-resistance protein SugE